MSMVQVAVSIQKNLCRSVKREVMHVTDVERVEIVAYKMRGTAMA